MNKKISWEDTRGLPIATILLGCVIGSQAYCWQAGYNPGFTGPPTVYQVKLDTVRVSWKNIVKNRECADQFLVKYWQSTQPSVYYTTDLVSATDNSTDIKVTPEIAYKFQAVAQEDKGLIGGIDWNKSPIVEYMTTTLESRQNPLSNAEIALVVDGRKPSYHFFQQQPNQGAAPPTPARPLKK